MKTLKYIIAMLSLSFCLNVSAATRYVSDDIFIYLHSGPSLDYRIIGTVKVGAPVTTLKYDKTTKFMQIKTAAGKTGWAQNKQLQETLPAKILLPKVQLELQEAQTKLANIAEENKQTLQGKVQSIAEKENLIASLQGDKKSLQQTIAELKARNLDLELQQDTEGDRIKMEWLLNGGYVLFGGVLLGLIIPFLPRRKKRQNNW